METVQCKRCSSFLGPFVKMDNGDLYCKVCFEKIPIHDLIDQCIETLDFANSALDNCCNLLNSYSKYKTTAEGVGYEAIEKNNNLIEILKKRKKILI